MPYHHPIPPLRQNIYKNNADEMVCSCVPSFTGQRFAAIGNVYTSCITSEVAFTASFSRKKAKPRKRLVYSLRASSKLFTYLDSNALALRVDLPAEVKLIRAKVLGKGIVQKQPRVNASALTWGEFPLRRIAKPRMVTVKVKPKKANAPLTSAQLVFEATIYQPGTDCAVLTEKATVSCVYVVVRVWATMNGLAEGGS
jgi:hypothetical protein